MIQRKYCQEIGTLKEMFLPPSMLFSLHNNRIIIYKYKFCHILPRQTDNHGSHKDNNTLFKTSCGDENSLQFNREASSGIYSKGYTRSKDASC